MLYAIGVLEVDIDRAGKVTRLRWMRAPKHAPEVVAEIERTVRAAAPFPAPTRMGKVTYTDTWLWDKSGHFQRDTLTEGQREVHPPERLRRFPLLSKSLRDFGKGDDALAAGRPLLGIPGPGSASKDGHAMPRTAAVPLTTHGRSNSSTACPAGAGGSAGRRAKCRSPGSLGSENWVRATPHPGP